MSELLSDEQLDQEFAYTAYNDSCQDLYTINQMCRRPRGHSGMHASGFGRDRSRWPNQTEAPDSVPKSIPHILLITSTLQSLEKKIWTKDRFPAGQYSLGLTLTCEYFGMDRAEANQYYLYMLRRNQRTIISPERFQAMTPDEREYRGRGKKGEEGSAL